MYEIPRLKDEEVTKLLKENIKIVTGTSTHHPSSMQLYIAYIHHDYQRDVVLLWRYGYGGFEIFIPAPEEEEPYMIVCQDELGDCYTYGMWSSLDDLKDWLKNPTSLY